MYPMFLTLNLDDDQAIAVCRLLQQHQAGLADDEAQPFAAVAREIAEAVTVRRNKLTDEKLFRKGVE